jgi:RND superfamily putative drug exporter
MILVPAIMAWLGDRVWWMPRWLDRTLPSFDIEGAALAKKLAAAEEQRELVDA